MTIVVILYDIHTLEFAVHVLLESPRCPTLSVLGSQCFARPRKVM